MAGKTGMVVGLRSEFIHVPIGMATGARQRVHLEGSLWRSVLASTGQPHRFG
jgi:6-phosphofructokinase 1